jgi:outer membrane protein OmpA-like peptidoglycan-associated protein
MNWTSQRRILGRTLGGKPLLSATLLAMVGLCWDGALGDARAQTSGGASSPVIVNYDVLNALPGQPAPYGAAAPAGGQVRSQFLPGYAPLGAPTTPPPYTPYGTAPSAYQPQPVAPGLTAGLPAAPSGVPTSGITTLGPDGRPVTPITLKKPGSPSATPAQVAEATPPAEPSDVPAEVPMPAATPPAPEPDVTAPAPEVEASVPDAPEEQPAETAESAEPAAEEAPAEETTAVEEAPVEEAPVEEATAAEAPAEEAPAEPTQEAAVTPPADAPAEETPAEEEAAEAEPDNTQPAPAVPEGGIRIVFPTEMNDVPPEANAALDDLAAQMLADESMRIQIMCYASGTLETESKARRKSLARCINIRQYLFKKEVRTTRMDVRAMGLKSEGQPADRVDIVPASS